MKGEWKKGKLFSVVYLVTYYELHSLHSTE